MGEAQTTYGYNIPVSPTGYDTTEDHYGRLWEIKTTQLPGGTPVLQDIQHTWDAAGNLTQRKDEVTKQKESFYYDFLDRLISPNVTPLSPGDADGDGFLDTLDTAYVERVILRLSPPTAGCDANQDGSITITDITRIETMLVPYYNTYNALGNITAKNGIAYTYGDNNHKHAVTAVGDTGYDYDANGNMTERGNQTLSWDVENRLMEVSGEASFVYDGDSNRVKKTEGGRPPSMSTNTMKRTYPVKKQPLAITWAASCCRTRASPEERHQSQLYP